MDFCSGLLYNISVIFFAENTRTGWRGESRRDLISPTHSSGLSALFFVFQEQKLTEISFEADTIEGDLMAPNSSNIAIKEIDELSSLIRAREDFVDEMRKTVDEL